MFAATWLPALRDATADLSWLIAKRYKLPGALALVGNRYSLRTRQRLAVQRAACTDDERAKRGTRRVLDESALAGERILIDGFNVIIAVEAAIARGVLIIGRDGVVRDMASVHGSYRRVAETVAALERIGETLASVECKSAQFWLDRPVSNSGRLAALIREHVGSRIETSVELANDPDGELIKRRAEGVVCSGDSLVLDGCGSWFDLSAAVVTNSVDDPWLLDFRADG